MRDARGHDAPAAARRRGGGGAAHDSDHEEQALGSDTDSDVDDDAGTHVAAAHRSTDRAIRYLLEVVATHGPFDAIVGYSEGATMAATMLLYQQRRQRRWGPAAEPLFKYAVFFAGWPPLDPRTHDMVLSDESEERIETRTLHIGKKERCTPS